MYDTLVYVFELSGQWATKKKKKKATGNRLHYAKPNHKQSWHGYIFNFRPAFKTEPGHNHVFCHLYGLCHLLQVQFDFQLWCIHALFVWLCRWGGPVAWWIYALNNQCSSSSSSPGFDMDSSVTRFVTNTHSWEENHIIFAISGTESCVVSRTVDFQGCDFFCLCICVLPWPVGQC